MNPKTTLPEPFEYDTELLKDQMFTYVDRNLADRVANITNTGYALHCPIHGDDNNESCSIDNNKGTPLYYCHACGSTGSLLDLHATRNGFEPWSAENLASLTEALGLTFEDVKATTRCTYDTPPRGKVSRPRASESGADEELTQSIKANLASMLAPFMSDSLNWRSQLIESSPFPLESHAVSPTHDLIRTLIQNDDVIWMGDYNDSGQPKHASNFRTCREWLQEKQLPPRLAAGIFKPGSVSRSTNSVLSSPFIVIESDNIIGIPPNDPTLKVINKCFSAALISYAQDQWGLTLRAVIDTGNKSLHAWFDRPSEDELDSIKKMARGFCIDSTVLKRAQALPLRAPGCIHEKSNLPATLLYLNPKY